ncbi:hypothetical protein [Streptomyces benahoarensis]|uniref:Uncharacterized protein n=1 Tax=Streptomyces benahoarensis TaxID=2595054 RepID=A0A553ZFN7_9ACTN|nr:hypothetical protein [Streptomyces benahoarensis]TSB21585.1 hypothetical protein FNJ62_18000 [Streptomyces benahoarensis]TSB40239.1 hypothetical protein FNZ23_14365 [Streptomyces benahoarensis]
MPPEHEKAPQSAVPGPAGGYRNAPVSAPAPDLTPPGPVTSPDGSGLLAVDFTALLAAIKAAESAAGEAQRAAAQADDATARSGPAPWGDDPGLGQAFGDAFAGPRADLVRTAHQLHLVLRQLADDLAATRGAFAHAEGTALEAVTVLGRRLADLGGAAS